MTVQEILQRHIGNKLKGGLVQSFYLNNELSDLINVTFIKLDEQWIRIALTDERITIHNQDISIEKVDFYGDEIFNYPIRPIDDVFPDFTKYIGKQLLGYKELFLKESENEYFGINFYFEDNLNFVIVNQFSENEEKNKYLFSLTDLTKLKEK